jgi:site-specific DNA-methyltransferase (adenine-specific)
MHTLINADCLDYLNGNSQTWTTCFCDPPDNIGLGYQTYKDKLPDEQYVDLLSTWLHLFVYKAKTVWFSFNAKWSFEVGRIVSGMLGRTRGLEAKPCVQTFTFGQHCHHDLGNNHRPLLRLRWFDAPLRPDAIRVPSWRQENGDKRADPRGRVPGDVFDFTRVVGNSKQRRPWHPTQLNEGLVERCVRLTTPEGESVLDPFGGTGTTLRVCRPLGYPCTLIEIDEGYCTKIVEEHGMKRSEYIHRALWEVE